MEAYEPVGLSPAWKSPQTRGRFRGNANYRKSETPLLLPVDLRDWVPENDLVHFVVHAVETMNLTTLSVNRRGTGDEQYPPRMMLALLIYCYAGGVFGSRRIKRATYRDLAVRYDRAGELEQKLRTDIGAVAA